MTYLVQKVSNNVDLNGNWDNEVWKNIPALELTNFMGNKPEHFPKTQAKTVYDNDYIHVIFRVEDNYVRAVAKKTQDCVCRDSCVEFFFVPNNTFEGVYFNLEINCGGTFLFHQQSAPRNGQEVAASDCEKIKVYHHLPKIIDPEITTPTVWAVEFSIPFSILENYTAISRPSKGVCWKANFYKCADSTSHPHWLTWNLVQKPTPDFHIPKYFGEIEFG
jgi:hypothetical protein